MQAAEVGRASIVADYAAGLLQAAIRVHQLRAYDAHVRLAGQRRQQRIEPARLRNRVVVEEDEKLTPGLRRTIVAGCDEAAVLGSAVVSHAVHLVKRESGFVRGS